MQGLQLLNHYKIGSVQTLRGCLVKEYTSRVIISFRGDGYQR